MNRIAILSALLLALTVSLAQAADEKKFYDPVEHKIEGWTIAVDPALLTKENAELKEKVFKALANHLQRIAFVMQEDRLAKLKTMRIWLELNNPTLGNMQYHPDAKWLRKFKHDPRLVKHVHIPRAQSLLNRGTWLKHPYVVLHELAHAYHDQVLSFNNKKITTAWNDAKAKGIYDKVMLYTGRKNVKHYALTSPMEYFAESTEAYFGVNDFYPFVRGELKEHDPVMYALLQEIWGKL